MRIKFINHLLLIANILFILGIVITTILVNNTPNYDQASRVLFNYIPFIVLLLLSLVSATIFAHFRKEYFILIKSHLSEKSIRLFKASVFMLFFNLIVAIAMLFLGLCFFININEQNTNFFKNVYLYIVLGIEMFLTLVDVGIDAIAKLKVKVDLALKRSGTDEFLKEDKDEQSTKNS